jgi:WD40 repeat protein
VSALVWRKDSKVLASAGEDGELVQWNPEDGFPIVTDTKTHVPKANGPTYGKPQSGIVGADFMPDGRLVTAGRDRMVHIFNSDGKPQSASSVFDRMLTKVTGTMMPNVILAGDYDGRIVVWDGHKVDVVDSRGVEGTHR